MPTAKPANGRLGVVTKNVVSLRKDPDADTPRATQATIGQTVAIEGGQGDWLFVQMWDRYRGWIPSHAVRVLDDGSEPYATVGPVAVIRELFVDVLEQPRDGATIITRATLSVELEITAVRAEWVELRMPEGRPGFIRTHQAKLVDKDAAQTIWLPEPRKLVETAMRLIGTPYLWGGTTPFGIDCSGFMQLIHRVHGVTLPRNSYLQAGDERGVPVEKDDVQTGDLVFFGQGVDPDCDSVNHVGMVVDGKRFIHSHGKGGVSFGLLADEMHRYWGARRMRLATMDPGGGAPED